MGGLKPRSASALLNSKLLAIGMPWADNHWSAIYAYSANAADEQTWQRLQVWQCEAVLPSGC
jgi:hypothetical protein